MAVLVLPADHPLDVEEGALLELQLFDVVEALLQMRLNVHRVADIGRTESLGLESLFSQKVWTNKWNFTWEVSSVRSIGI